MKSIKQLLNSYIQLYSSGLLSISECFARLDNTIQKATDNISNTDDRISQQNKLYIYGMAMLTKAIKQNERM